MSGIKKTKLLLAEINMTDRSLKKLLSSLTRIAGNTLEIDTLDLSMNRITDEGCEMIAEFLKEQKSIKGIHLRDNIHITLEGMRKIVKAAIKCRKLQILDFDHCNIELKTQNLLSFGF